MIEGQLIELMPSGSSRRGDHEGARVLERYLDTVRASSSPGRGSWLKLYCLIARGSSSVQVDRLSRKRFRKCLRPLTKAGSPTPAWLLTCRRLFGRSRDLKLFWAGGQDDRYASVRISGGGGVGPAAWVGVRTWVADVFAAVVGHAASGGYFSHLNREDLGGWELDFFGNDTRRLFGAW